MVKYNFLNANEINHIKKEYLASPVGHTEWIERYSNSAFFNSQGRITKESLCYLFAFAMKYLMGENEKPDAVSKEWLDKQNFEMPNGTCFVKGYVSFFDALIAFVDNCVGAIYFDILLVKRWSNCWENLVGEESCFSQSNWVGNFLTIPLIADTKFFSERILDPYEEKTENQIKVIEFIEWCTDKRISDSLAKLLPAFIISAHYLPVKDTRYTAYNHIDRIWRIFDGLYFPSMPALPESLKWRDSIKYAPQGLKTAVLGNRACLSPDKEWQQSYRQLSFLLNLDDNRVNPKKGFMRCKAVHENDYKLFENKLFEWMDELGDDALTTIKNTQLSGKLLRKKNELSKLYSHCANWNILQSYLSLIDNIKPFADIDKNISLLALNHLTRFYDAYLQCWYLKKDLGDLAGLNLKTYLSQTLSNSPIMLDFPIGNTRTSFNNLSSSDIKTLNGYIFNSINFVKSVYQQVPPSVKIDLEIKPKFSMGYKHSIESCIKSLDEELLGLFADFENWFE